MDYSEENFPEFVVYYLIQWIFRTDEGSRGGCL